MKLVFATNNKNKLVEISRLIHSDVQLLSLDDIGCTDEVPENQLTLEGNALEKASYIFEKIGVNCFADDTGLEVDALNGEPGVFSARYAGPEKSAEANITKLLQELSGKTNRNARFRTVIALILDGKEYLFEGIVNGRIIAQRQGTSGFGYDPVFVPDGYTETFAQMDLNLKNQISHRGMATRKLIDFLNTLS